MAAEEVLFGFFFFFCMYLQICHFMACTDISVITFKNIYLFISLCVSLSFPANHRRAGHAVTNILAKELMQEDTPSSSNLKKEKKKTEEKDEPKLEGAESLEELLDAAPSRSN